MSLYSSEFFCGRKSHVNSPPPNPPPSGARPEYAILDEDEVRRHRNRPVEGFRGLVHGRFVVGDVERLANRWNIDTGAGFTVWNRLTLLQINTPRMRFWTVDVIEDCQGHFTLGGL